MSALKAGAAIPVYPITGRVSGGMAVPVYGLNAHLDRVVAGGAALPVYLITAADLAGNGGEFELMGDPVPLPVYAVTDRPVLATAPLPVYLVSGSLQGRLATLEMIDTAVEADEADAYNYGGGVYLHNITDYAGFHGGNEVWMGFRFADLPIQAGATILSAVLELCAVDVFGEVAQVHWQIVADAQDNPGVWTAEDGPLTITETSAKVEWSPEAWAAGVNYMSPDFQPVLAEIIARPGWTAGNAVRIVVKNNGSGAGSALGARDYSADPALAARLHVMFSH